MQTGEFWLLHQFDNRGEVYHTPHFGHHTQDYLRGMFLFANKTKVSEGLDYLKVQTANSYGEDKEAIADRIAWFDKHEAEILAVGEDFKASKQVMDFWRVADEPIQFVAACHEYWQYKQNPDYESGLPVGQDATQSGIQHFAASIKDAGLGAKVNLTKSSVKDKPADIYTMCLHRVRNDIAQDIPVREKAGRWCIWQH